jgi:hypothetical protein
VAELERLIQAPKYDPKTPSEELARDLAYHAGRIWALERLNSMIIKYTKGD